MPKQKITKKMVVDAAFEIAKDRGMEDMLVKNIADKIGCSVQPIYSYCENMEGLKLNVIERTKEFIQSFLVAHIDKDDLFRSTGNAYIQLAKEEPHLFKIFILHERKGISSLEDLYQSETNPKIAEFIAKNLHISISKAKQLHLNMLIYTIGIGTIFSMTTPGISTNEIFAQQNIAYEAFIQQILKKEEERENER